MIIFIYVLLILAIGIMLASVIQLFSTQRIPFPVFSWSHFCVLLFAYVILILGFAVLYLGLILLRITGVGFVGISVEAKFAALLGDILYFSTMTMLTVGYGDITPVGLGKLVAGIQALIGYLLPTAFFISGIISLRNTELQEVLDKQEFPQKQSLK